MNVESSIALLGGSLPIVAGSTAFFSDWMLPANGALIPAGLVAGVGRVGPVPVMFAAPAPVPPDPVPDPDPEPPPEGFEYPPPPLIVPGPSWEEVWPTLAIGYEWETDAGTKWRKTGTWTYEEILP